VTVRRGRRGPARSPRSKATAGASKRSPPRMQQRRRRLGGAEVISPAGCRPRETARCCPGARGRAARGS
jgi:hypothetical protein